MSKRSAFPIPAWLRRRGYSQRTKRVIASAVARSAHRRDAAEPETLCRIIPFPMRPRPAQADALGVACLLQAGI